MIDDKKLDELAMELIKVTRDEFYGRINTVTRSGKIQEINKEAGCYNTSSNTVLNRAMEKEADFVKKLEEKHKQPYSGKK